jgi:orotate phosphoribosyltransferase
MADITVPETQNEAAEQIYKSRAYETYENRQGFPKNHPFIGNARGLLLDYLDIRILNGKPEERTAIIKHLSDTVNKLGSDILGGFVSADLTFLGMVADRLGKPCFYVREDEKAHGTGRIIEGLREDEISGKTITHVGDLLTTGKASVNLITAANGAGGIVKYHTPIFDRLQGGREKLLGMNVEVRPICIANSDFYNTGLALGYVTENFLEQNKTYRSNTSEWVANYLRNNPDFFEFELQRKGVIVNGELKKPDSLEVLTRGYPQLKDEFTPYINNLLKELGVNQSIPEFNYRI